MFNAPRWRWFWLEGANNDMEAQKLAGSWVIENSAEAYRLEKITTERLV